ncbi:cell wall-associated NlpC family hydrolase [Rhizobium mongolense]|uniref:Cell wall-associated NlpC family hydrolase n=3 Tax=Rhizobium mongolense TaxID=57676 RepID=A0ABR6IR76_9HYPH|nr:cell wall-associated NlpC family hydrolase [Rhizobium mongolense]TVZ65631.1 NlpC/P60 family protein [Rhizobium mongolense USDA 1844]
MLDRRLNAYRPDLAEASLEGKVEALRFVSGTPARVAVPVAPLRPQPEPSVGIDTELLLGEDVTVLDRAGGWCWVKASSDGYVGYMPEEMLSDSQAEPTHIVTVQRTFLYPQPELRKPYNSVLSMGSRVRVAGEAEVRGNHYVVLEDGTAIFARHVQPVTSGKDDDYVEIASRFMNAPYLWGGRSGLGIDCSGLVQLAMLMTGKSAPRDTDMQAASLGARIDRSGLRRGDLVFWKGHVAIMEDPETIIHANGYTMTVARENFEAAVKRIGQLYQQPTGYRRPV